MRYTGGECSLSVFILLLRLIEDAAKPPFKISDGLLISRFMIRQPVPVMDYFLRQGPHRFVPLSVRPNFHAGFQVSEDVCQTHLMGGPIAVKGRVIIMDQCSPRLSATVHFTPSCPFFGGQNTEPALRVLRRCKQSGFCRFPWRSCSRSAVQGKAADPQTRAAALFWTGS